MYRPVSELLKEKYADLVLFSRDLFLVIMRAGI